MGNSYVKPDGWKGGGPDCEIVGQGSIGRIGMNQFEDDLTDDPSDNFNRRNARKGEFGS